MDGCWHPLQCNYRNMWIWLLSSPAQVWRCVERVVQFAIASLDGRATVCIATDQKSFNWEEEKLALAVRNELSIKWYQAYRLSSIDGVTCRMFPWRETVGLPIRVKLGRSMLSGIV